MMVRYRAGVFLFLFITQHQVIFNLMLFDFPGLIWYGIGGHKRRQPGWYRRSQKKLLSLLITDVVGRDKGFFFVSKQRLQHLLDVSRSRQPDRSRKERSLHKYDHSSL